MGTCTCCWDALCTEGRFAEAMETFDHLSASSLIAPWPFTIRPEIPRYEAYDQAESAFREVWRWSPLSKAPPGLGYIYEMTDRNKAAERPISHPFFDPGSVQANTRLESYMREDNLIQPPAVDNSSMQSKDAESRLKLASSTCSKRIMRTPSRTSPIC